MMKLDPFEIEESLSDPGNVSLVEYSSTVEAVLADRSLSALPQIHLAIAKGFHDLKAFERGIHHADRAITLARSAPEAMPVHHVLEWSYLVKAECARKLNRRLEEIRTLAKYNRSIGMREVFKRQETALLQEYTTRLHARSTFLFPSLIVIIVAMHRFLGLINPAALYVSLLLPLILISAWSVFFGRSFKRACAWLMTIGL
jgi:hypothetical protein